MKHGPLAGLFVLIVVLTSPGCVDRSPLAAPAETPTVLRVGFGLTTGQNPQGGLQQALVNISSEALFAYPRDGRFAPWLADSWAVSSDGSDHAVQQPMAAPIEGP